MKFLMTILFCSSSVLTMAQHKTSHISKTIDDDGSILTLKIKANTEKGAINYQKEFDIRGLSQQQKDSVIDHIMDSLQLPKSNTFKKLIIRNSSEPVQSGKRTEL